MSSLKLSNEALQALHVLLLNIFIAAILLALFTLPLQLLPDALLKLSAQSDAPASTLVHSPHHLRSHNPALQRKPESPHHPFQNLPLRHG